MLSNTRVQLLDGSVDPDAAPGALARDGLPAPAPPPPAAALAPPPPHPAAPDFPPAAAVLGPLYVQRLCAAWLASWAEAHPANREKLTVRGRTLKPFLGLYSVRHGGGMGAQSVWSSMVCPHAGLERGGGGDARGGASERPGGVQRGARGAAAAGQVSARGGVAGFGDGQRRGEVHLQLVR